MAGSRPKISAVVPAYNEQNTVGQVVQTLVDHPLVDEVIVVSDGSTDRTAAAARAAQAQVLELPRNRGKGAAIWAGAQVAQGELLLVLDADLRGLTAAHLDGLLSPVLSGQAHTSVGLLACNRSFPVLAGQRVIPRAFLLAAPQLAQTRFDFETKFERLVKRKKLQRGRVLLEGLTHRTKSEKYPPRLAVRKELQFCWDLLKTPKAFALVTLLPVLLYFGIWYAPGQAQQSPFAPVPAPAAGDRVLIVAPHIDDEAQIGRAHV